MPKTKQAINPFAPPRDWEEEAKTKQFSFSWFEKWNLLRLIDNTLRWSTHFEHSLERGKDLLEQLAKKIETQANYNSLLIILSNLELEVDDAVIRSLVVEKYFSKVREKLSLPTIPPQFKEKADTALVNYDFINHEFVLHKTGRVKKGLNALKTELALFGQGKGVPALIIRKSEGLALLLALGLSNTRTFQEKIKKLKEAVKAEQSSLLGNTKIKPN